MTVMKRLLLTSDGLNDKTVIDFCVGQFKNPENMRACVVATRRLPGDQIYIDAAKKELEDLGVRTDAINISEDIDIATLIEYDIYYSCGGNTFYILDRMRKTGVDKVLMKAVEDGKFYIGVSAGSMLVGPDISLSDAYGDDESDANDIGLQDLTGFGLVPYFIMPHYTEQYEQAARKFQEKISKDRSVVGLTDAQALFVTDDEAVLIGEQGGFLSGDISHIRNTTR